MKRERQCHSNKFLAWAILIFDSCCIPTRSIWLLTEARLVHMVRKPSEWIVQLSLKYLLYVYMSSKLNQQHAKPLVIMILYIIMNEIAERVWWSVEAQARKENPTGPTTW